MRVQVVLHDANLLGLRIGRRQFPHKLGVVEFRPSVRDASQALARLWLNGHQQSARAVLFIGVMLPGRLASFHLQPGNAVADQKTRALVKANQRVALVYWQAVEVENLLHAGNESRVHNANAPGLVQMRSEFVFFRIFLAAVCDKRFKWPSSTALSASRRKVQRARPSGGVEQARAVILAR